MRYRNTYGVSAPGPYPGTRQWASRSVSYGPGTLIAAVALKILLWAFILGPLWILAESWVITISAVTVMGGWWVTKTVPQYDVRFARGRLKLWYLTGRPL